MNEKATKTSKRDAANQAQRGQGLGAAQRGDKGKRPVLQLQYKPGSRSSAGGLLQPFRGLHGRMKMAHYPDRCKTEIYLTY